MKFHAEIPAIHNVFAASITVQVLSTGEKNHHVLRTDIHFEATGEEDWYTTRSMKILGLKFYEKALTLRIVNVEVGLNKLFPLHFSMCHFNRYKTQDKQWNTFPLYIQGNKFMIIVYANVEGRNGKTLTMKLYRMMGEKGKMLPDRVTVTVKLTKKAGGHTIKQFVITGKAAEIVRKGIEVDFQPNNRFPRYGTRSKYGASFTIPHTELDQYIHHDCFIFYVV